MAENLVSPVLSGQNTRTLLHLSGEAGGGEDVPVWRPVIERAARDDLKWYLMNKYRALFIDKLTCGDLEDLRYCLRQQSDPKHGGDHRYRKQFILKMGEFMPEDVLRTEITAIESLVRLMKPEDLRSGAERYAATLPARVNGLDRGDRSR